MDLTLTCHCGAVGQWTAATFGEINANAAEDGWHVRDALCPDHRADRIESTEARP